MFMLPLRLKRYFCNHNYDFNAIGINAETKELEIPDCQKCGKAWKSRMPKFEEMPTPPPDKCSFNQPVHYHSKYGK